MNDAYYESICINHNDLIDALPSLRQLGLIPTVPDIHLQRFRPPYKMHIDFQFSQIVALDHFRIFRRYFFIPSLRAFSAQFLFFGRELFERCFHTSLPETSGLTSLDLRFLPSTDAFRFYRPRFLSFVR